MANEWQLLTIRLQMEVLITEREKMVAENQDRAHKGLAQAYGEDAFQGNMAALDHLLDQLRNL